jgi:hypothetical protein
MRTKFIISSIIFWSLFIIGFSFSYRNSSSSRVPASSSIQQPQIDIPKDLLLASQNFLNFVNDRSAFTLDTCEVPLKNIYNELYKIDPKYFNREQTVQNFKEIIRNIFEARLAIRDRLKEFNIAPENADHPCLGRIRDIVRLGRYIEDYLGEVFLGVKPFDEKVDPKAIGTFTGEEPWLLKKNRQAPVEFKSGDIIISRGGAVTSAAIARITEIDSQFSHVAFLYSTSGPNKVYSLQEAIDAKDLFVLEAHIEIGSTIRPFSQYLEDGNSRNVHFRYFDGNVAHQAAELSYNYMVAFTENAYKNRGSIVKPTQILLGKEHPDFKVPYDFKMDLSKADEIFCSEVAYFGFHKKEVRLPLYDSKLASARDNGLIKALGIQVSRTFAPGDMEHDTRFEMLEEWRDYRKMRTIRYKDTAILSIYDWMKRLKYQLKPTPFVSVGARLFAFARYFDFPKFSINGKVLLNLEEKLPKNMSGSIAAYVETLNQVGASLEAELSSIEDTYRKENNGLNFTLAQSLIVLENFRQKDSLAFEQNRKPIKFHKIFRPN